MKRLGQWLFNLAAGVSLVLCICFSGIWGLSFWRADVIQCNYSIHRAFSPDYHRTTVVASTVGSMCLTCIIDGSPTGYAGSESATWDWAYDHPSLTPHSTWESIKQQFRFSWSDGQPVPRIREIQFMWPIWLLVFLFSLLPLICWRQYLKRRKHQYGLCPNCGYDLRATPDRCPECGTVPTAKGATP